MRRAWVSSNLFMGLVIVANPRDVRDCGSAALLPHAASNKADNANAGILPMMTAGLFVRF